MRLITIDNGNSNPHVGIFQGEELLEVIALKEYSPLADDYILVSDVGYPLPYKASFDLKKIRHNKENPNFLEMPVHYSETLGDDRLFLAYFLFKKLEANELILAIDAGTFITMDVINEKGFHGGFIFPGEQTFLDSYQKGSKLPVVSPRETLANTFPQSTEEAIIGALNIYLDSILETVINKAAPSRIVITGGSQEIIKNKILKLNLVNQLETDPHLIHQALALIYQHHLHSKA